MILETLASSRQRMDTILARLFKDMINLRQAITSVMLGTLSGGALGGATGFAIGRLAPSFIHWLGGPFAANGDPSELALGLGIVSGLILGAGASIFLASAIILRDGLLARDQPKRPTSVSADTRDTVD